MKRNTLFLVGVTLISGALFALSVENERIRILADEESARVTIRRLPDGAYLFASDVPPPSYAILLLDETNALVGSDEGEMLRAEEDGDAISFTWRLRGIEVDIAYACADGVFIADGEAVHASYTIRNTSPYPRKAGLILVYDVFLGGLNEARYYFAQGSVLSNEYYGSPPRYCYTYARLTDSAPRTAFVFPEVAAPDRVLITERSNVSDASTTLATLRRVAGGTNRFPFFDTPYTRTDTALVAVVPARMLGSNAIAHAELFFGPYPFPVVPVGEHIRAMLGGERYHPYHGYAHLDVANVGPETNVGCDYIIRDDPAIRVVQNDAEYTGVLPPFTGYHTSFLLALGKVEHHVGFTPFTISLANGTNERTLSLLLSLSGRFGEGFMFTLSSRHNSDALRDVDVRIAEARTNVAAFNRAFFGITSVDTTNAAAPETNATNTPSLIDDAAEMSAMTRAWLDIVFASLFDKRDDNDALNLSLLAERLTTVNDEVMAALSRLAALPRAPRRETNTPPPPPPTKNESGPKTVIYEVYIITN